MVRPLPLRDRAPYFRTEFFDPDSLDSLIYVYGLFALTFVVRPLGSWLFGRLPDTQGRHRALVAAVAMMSAVFLVVVRLLQGVATGPEYAAATVFCLSRAHGATADSSPHCSVLPDGP